MVVLTLNCVFFGTDNVSPGFVKGDDKYTSISAASILAKVYHDEYIEKLCKENPKLDERYGWRSNMCYGTAQHIEGIKQYGISQYHRKSFGICKNYA